MPDELPFEAPQSRLSPEELADIAKAVANQPALWEDGLRQTTAERTYSEVFTNEHLGTLVHGAPCAPEHQHLLNQ
jgi:hypothetical protein